MEEDYELAARALEAAGQPETARMLRVRAHQQRGEVEEASRLLEQSGQLTQAADLLAETQLDGTQSAALYEEAGEFVRAAEIHRASGDMVAAARAYESGYDYANAIECYQQLGDDEKLVELLEKTAENFEAGKLARELGQTGRAIKNLQLVEKRHAFYSEACRELGVLLADQGSADFALEKLDEAKGVGGLDSFPNELLDRYGRLLEEQGRIEDAVEVLSALRRKDVSYANVDARIQALKQQATDLQATRVTGSAGATAATGGAGAPSPALSTRYEILGQLGAGGMGVVYKAKDKHLGRLVALKKLPDNLTAHPAAVKFFEREARSAAALNHPNIVTVFDAGQENGHYFITMEMLEGTPLDGIVKKHGALPPLVVAQLGVQIATGLHFAHHNKIIHRDIKTANLFLTRDKIVKIMDFGLAKMVEEVRKGATVIGGTPYYMAPEQAGGEDVDHRADLYALGVTLYQLATANLPFTEGDISYHHRHTPPPDPREFVPELPGPLAELILQLLEKVPADRTQRAADVVKVLQSMIDQAAQHRTQAQS
jgi:serine/threonine-protein kinase